MNSVGLVSNQMSLRAKKQIIELGNINRKGVQK